MKKGASCGVPEKGWMFRFRQVGQLAQLTTPTLSAAPDPAPPLDAAIVLDLSWPTRKFSRADLPAVAGVSPPRRFAARRHGTDPDNPTLAA